MQANKKDKPKVEPIQLYARTHKEVAEAAGITDRAARNRRDMFAVVLVRSGNTTNEQGEKVPKYIRRYLDRETTALLNASGLYGKSE